MNPDLLAACIAWLRTFPAIVAAFGDSSATPKFSSQYESPVVPALPYLVFLEGKNVASYETVDQAHQVGETGDGMLTFHVFDEGMTSVRQLADDVATALQDADLVFSNGALLLFRRLLTDFPVSSSTGPDGRATVYKRTVLFRALTEKIP